MKSLLINAGYLSILTCYNSGMNLFEVVCKSGDMAWGLRR